MMIKMEKNQIEQLQLELNELSENEKQNLERMKEIARILVDFYMPNKNTNGNDGMCKLLKDDWEKEQQTKVLH